jgi:hypothetical protein
MQTFSATVYPCIFILPDFSGWQALWLHPL